MEDLSDSPLQAGHLFDQSVEPHHRHGSKARSERSEIHGDVVGIGSGVKGGPAPARGSPTMAIAVNL